MPNYTDRDKIELVFGSIALDKWCDLDGDKQSNKIENRVDWASELATEYLNGRFARGRYTIPFTAVPKTIIHLATLLAGILLHDGRAMAGTDKGRDEVSRQRKMFHSMLRQVGNGQLKLLHPTTGEELELTCEVVPVANTTAIASEYVVDADCCSECYCHTCICPSLRCNYALYL